VAATQKLLEHSGWVLVGSRSGHDPPSREAADGGLHRRNGKTPWMEVEGRRSWFGFWTGRGAIVIRRRIAAFVRLKIFRIELKSIGGR
jgi:hypothetical protein